MKGTLKFDWKSFNHYYPDGGELLKKYHLDGGYLGVSFLSELKDTINYLESHNKNYTNKQYYLIRDLQEIFKFMEIDNDT